jgi:hypothetical protein
MKTTLKNSFHNTEITITVPDDIRERQLSAWDYVQLQDHQAAQDRKTYANSSSHRLLLKIKKTLCGTSDCSCGIVR